MTTKIKDLADDLDSFLKTVKLPPAKPRPAAREEQVQTPVDETSAAPADPFSDPDVLVRACWNYVSSKMEEQDGPDLIGQSFMLAVAALAKDAGVSVDAMNSAAIDFLESIVESAREAL